MKTKTPLFRIDRLLIAALALFAAPQAHTQTTYLYTNTGASGTWMTANNWQTNGVTSTTAPSNASTAVVRFTNSGAITMGVNLNQTALGNTVSIGSLLKENTANLTMNNSSGTVSGQLRLFGTSSGSDTNLIVSLGTGALIITNGSQLMDLQLATGGIINVSNSGGRVVLASLIKEDVGETNTITKTGSGTLVISGTNVNTWGGGVVLNAGVLQLNKTSALGSASGLGLTINGGSLDNGSGGAITLSNYAQTWGGDFSFIGTTNLNLGAGSVNLTGARTVTVSARALTVGGAITNTGGITKAGAGTLVLGGANTYTGTTTVNAGTLALSNVNALQNSVLDTGTAGAQAVSFVVDGANTYNIGGLQGSDDLDNTGNTLSVGSRGGNTTYSGALSGAGALIKTGAGTLTLTSASNVYSGGTTIDDGAIEITGANRLGNVNGALTINNGKLLVTTGGVSSGRNIVLGNANSTIEVASGLTYTATNNSVVSGSGRLNKTGSGVLALFGTNTYSGGTVVSEGTLAGNTAGVRGAITNNATVNFIVTNNGTYSGAMTGLGALTKSGAATLTTTGINDFSGATTINAGALIINGTNANSAVAVNSTATIGGTGSVGATTINSGGTMSPGLSPGTQTYSSLVWEGGGNYNWQLHDATGSAGTGYDTFVSTGAFTINATSGNKFNLNLWTLSGIGPDTNGSAINFTGTSDYTWTLGNFGSISGFAANAFSINTSATNGTSGFANLFSGTFSVSTNATQLLLVYTAPLVSSVYTWNTTDGLWSDGANWAGALAPSNTSSIVFAGASGGVSTNDSQVNDISGLTFSNTAGSYTINGSAFTNGVSGVVNNSASAQTINNDITLGGIQSFNAASGDLTFGGAIDNNGNLFTVTGSSNTALNGVVSGNGGLTKSGNGSLTLGGNNTYTGALSVNAGTVLVNGTQATTTVNVAGGRLLLGGNNVLADGATLALSTGTVDFGGFTDTVTTFNQSGGASTNGTITATTYGLSGGTVGGTLGAGTANVTGGVTLSGAINSTLNINTGGTLTLAANDRIGNSSAVTVNAGTLATATFNDTVGSIVLTNSGSITGTGTITADTYALNGGTVGGNLGTGAATSSAGTTTLNGTLAGDLTVSGGTLTLGGADRLGNSSAVTVSSGTLNFGGFSDTVGSFSLSGGVFTNGTVTTTLYSLSGGTMGGTLGAGTANVTGGVTLSGLVNSALNINTGGTLTLAAADRIANGSTVTVNGGSLNLGGFSDTISIYNQVAGTITNGTLVATTYNLDGGTVGANTALGAGTANVTNGAVTLNGTLAATTLNIAGGTLALGSNGRIDNATAVNLSGGALNLNTFIDTVGSFTVTGGTLSGTGTINADTGGFSLQGGTINANLGTGNVTASTGTTAINGTVAGNVTVSGGTINLGAADLIGNTSTVNVSSGALNLNGNDSVGAVTVSGGTVGGSGVLTGTSYAMQAGTISAGIGGSGAMTKTGAGTATLSANNTTTFSGAVAVNSGALLATTSGALGTGAVTITNGATLAGNGVTLSNNFTIGNAAGVSPGTNRFVAGWDFQSTNNGGTAAAASPNSPTVFRANFGDQGSNAVIYLTGTNGSSAWVSTNQLTAFGGSSLNTKDGMSTVTTGDSSLALVNPSANPANNQRIVLALDMTGLASLDLSYASRFSGSTAFNTHTWEYSTDGSSWTGFYTNTGLSTSFAVFSNASSITALSNSATAYLRLTVSGASATGGNNRLDNIQLNALSMAMSNSASGSGTLGINEAGSATFSGAITNNNVATLTAASGGTATFSGAISGLGSVTKTGEGTVTLSGANTYSGGTTINAGVLSVGDGGTSGLITGPINNNASLVFNRSDSSSYSGAIAGSGSMSKSGAGSLTLSGASSYSGATTITAGTLQLNNTTGQALASTIAVSVANEAVLLLSQSNQVNDSASVSLSGGTIRRDGEVSEVFGSLNLTQASFLDFGTGATGTLSFTSYTPSALLTVNNFLPGNKLTFTSNLSSDIENGALFSFGGQFQWDWDTTTPNTFTITAIPEPSTYLAAAGLLSLMLWPSRKRLLKDAKKILGLRAPMRDRLAAKRA